MTTASAAALGEVYYSAAAGRLIDGVNADGSGEYSKLPYEALKARDPDIERLPFEEGWRRYCARAIKAPWEITETRFQEMLNIMPPMKWTGSTFMMGSKLRGDITHIFCRIGSRYFEMQDSCKLTQIEIFERCRPLLKKS